jgi:hypothetical protein
MATPLFDERDRRARNSRLMLQALHRSELTASGDRLKAGREDTQRELQRIGRFLPGARQAGLSMTQISELTGVSRPTLYQLEKDQATQEDRDVPKVILTALGGLGPQTPDQLASVTKIAETTVADAVAGLVAAELVKVLTAYYTPDAPTAFLMLTQAGAEALQGLLVGPQ